MIPVLDAAGAPHIRIPLWSDPAIAQANWPDGDDEQTTEAAKQLRTDFIDSGNPAYLVVSTDATIATIRALSAAEMGTADRTAGRRPQLGAVMSIKRSAFIESIKTPTAKALAKMSESKREAVRMDAAATVAAWVDKLTDSEAQSLEDWSDWVGRRAVAVVKMGVVSIHHPTFGDCSIEVFAGSITDPALRSNILAELAHRVKAYSGLGIRPKGLPNSASGSKRLNESAATTGDVTDVMTGPDDGAVHVEAPSAPS